MSLFMTLIIKLYEGRLIMAIIYPRHQRWIYPKAEEDYWNPINPFLKARRLFTAEHQDGYGNFVYVEVLGDHSDDLERVYNDQERFEENRDQEIVQVR
jgi:hypothetical protein